MVDFRRWLPALAVGALFLGMASTSQAQITPAFSCVANAGVPPLVRAEGLAELTGDIILNCTGGTPTAVGALVPQVNIQVFLNTNITSRLVSDPLSEALLMIDEPQPAAGGGTGQQVACNPVSATVQCPLLGTGAGVNYLSGPAVPNVYQGRNAGTNSIVWLGVPIDPPGTVGTRVIRITNMRANANQLGVSSTLIPTQIVAFISASGSTSVPINNPSQTVAFVQPGLSFSLRRTGDLTSTIGTTGLNFLQCVRINQDLAASSSNAFNSGSSTSTSSTVPPGGGFATVARFTEGFATAFKRRTIAPTLGTTGAGRQTPATDPTVDTSETPAAQDVPGNIYNTESGFYQPAFAVNGLGTAGLADFGTRLMVRFSGIPAGVSVYVAIRDTTGSLARLVTTDANGAGGFSAAPATSTTTGAFASVGGIAPVVLSGGSGAAVYEVMNSSPLTIESIDIPLAVAFVANTASNLPGLGTASITGSFAPMSTVTTQSASAPVPRFADIPTNRTAFNFNACSTNLLFPFVTNQAGFDTGLAISNTSQDPFGTTTQAGACKLNYYGSTTGGGAAPSAQTSQSVAAGSQLLWVTSTGGNLGVTGTPGFQGYVIAQCSFQYAHGFAFITDGAIGQARVAEGYLALILDGAIGSRTVYASEVLAH